MKFEDLKDGMIVKCIKPIRLFNSNYLEVGYANNGDVGEIKSSIGIYKDSRFEVVFKGGASNYITEDEDESDIILLSIEECADPNIVYFAKLRDNATIPSKIEENGGYDVYAVLDKDFIVIYPHCTIMLNTGIISAFDSKYRIILAERGSTGVKGIGQRAGVIDSGFRGEWKVPITNHNDYPIILHKDGYNDESMIENLKWVYGDVVEYPISKAICQALIEEVPKVKIVESTVDEIMSIKSERGDNMLGSSGK